MMIRAYLDGLQPRDRRALRVGAWIGASLLLFGLVVRPYATSLTAQHAALARERDLLTHERRAVLELPQDRAALRSTEEMLSTVAPRLFEGSDVVTASAELVRYVSGQANHSGLQLEQVETRTRIDTSTATHTAANDAPTGGDLRVALRAHGDILAIYAFLRAVEGGPKLVRVERLEIVRLSGVDQAYDGTLMMTATIAGFARQKIAGKVVASISIENEP